MVTGLALGLFVLYDSFPRPTAGLRGELLTASNSCHCIARRFSYRILSWGGGKQDGSRMIVACEMHACLNVCVPTRGVWGHAPPGKFRIFIPLRLLLTQSETKFPNILMKHTYVQ